MGIKIGDSNLDSTLVQRLEHGGSVHDLTLLQTPEERVIPHDAVVQRADGSELLGSQWMRERQEMRDELVAMGQKDGKGNVMMTRTTIGHVLLRHPYWRGVIRTNQLRGLVEVGGEPVTDTFATRIVHWFETQWRFLHAKKSDIVDAYMCAAETNAYHPVREYLEQLPPWDGVDRIEQLVDVLHAQPEHRRIYGVFLRAWFVAAVKRVFQPGDKFDTMLVLQGAQGMRKSSFFHALASPWFNESPLDISKPSELGRVHTAWIHEFAELEKYTRGDLSTLKNFLSVREDRFRPPYGRHEVVKGRMCVFAGTSNEAEFLNDKTGARRFWIIKCAPRDIDTAIVIEIRDQLWAEALTMYRGEEDVWLRSSEDREAQAELAAEFEEIDPWAEPLRVYVERKRLIRIEDVLHRCFDVKIENQNMLHTKRVAAMLRQLGWTKARLRGDNDEQGTWWFRETDRPDAQGLLRLELAKNGARF